MFSFILSLLEKLFLLGHLGAGSFPKPLTEKEEDLLIQRLKQGDKEAEDKLIEHNLRLVAHIVKKYATTKDEADDFLSIGTIGLIKGIKSFHPDKSVRLSTYVAKCIHNEILMVIRGKKSSFMEVSLSETIGSDKEGNEVTLMDIIPSPDKEIEKEAEDKELIKKMYEGIKNGLTRRERIIIELRYGLVDGKSIPQREIAKMLKISRSYVSRIEKKALSKIKEEMERKI